MKKIFYSLSALTSLLLVSSLEARQCCLPKSGAYISGFGGVSAYNGESKKGGFSSKWRSQGYLAGAAVGYRFEQPYRLEAELAHRYNEIKKGTVEGPMGKELRIKGHKATTTAMANGYLDLCCSPSFTPYVGVGAGYAYDRGTVKGGETKVKGRKSGFASQYMAGVNVPVSRDLDVGVEYRYLLLNKNGNNHGLLVKLSHGF